MSPYSVSSSQRRAHTVSVGTATVLGLLDLEDEGATVLRKAMTR